MNTSKLKPGRSLLARWLRVWQLENLQAFRQRMKVRSRLNRIPPGSMGGSYFEQLVADLKQALDMPSELRAALDENQSRFQKGLLTWDDFYSLAIHAVPFFSVSRADAIRCELRPYFYRLARGDMRLAYEQSSPPPLNALAGETGRTSQPPSPLSPLGMAIRDDAARLYTYIAKIESYRPHQEAKRDEISVVLYLSMITTIVLIFGVVSIAIFSQWKASGVLTPSFLGLAAAIGAVGATMSAHRRLQESFDADASILLTTKYLGVPSSVKLVPFNGAVFAIVLIMVFSAELLPIVKTDFGAAMACHKNGQCSGLPLQQYALLLVLAFLAGFAERLVPDTLDRLGGNLQIK